MNYEALAIILLIYSLYSVVFSLFVCLLFWKYQLIQTHIECFFIFISIANIFCWSTTIISSCYYLYNQKPISDDVCFIFAIILNFFDLFNVFLNVLISIIIYLDYCEQLDTRKYSKIGFGICFITSFILTTVAATKFNLGLVDEIQCWSSDSDIFYVFYIPLLLGSFLIIVFSIKSFFTIRKVYKTNGIFFIIPLSLILTYFFSFLRRLLNIFDVENDALIYIMYFFFPMQGVFNSVVACLFNNQLKRKIKSIYHGEPLEANNYFLNLDLIEDH